jgi:hypothetical protein
MSDQGIEVRLEPQDEYMHPGPEPTFNESMYFNTYDPQCDLGLFVRIGNRPNEGHAEVTTCVYLPDGRVAFMFGRPEITGNERFEAGGASFEVVEPFEELRVRWSGRLVMLGRPLEMADPRAAFTENPYERCEFELTFRGASDPWGGEPVGRAERPGEEFAKGHYEQLTTATGTLSVGDDAFELDGRGLRDHSWGPRTWQAPWYYRWLTVNMGDGTGMMLSRIARKESDGVRQGFVWNGERLVPVTSLHLSTGWVGDDHHHGTVNATFTMEGPDGRPAERELTGRVKNLIPLRNRREGRVTRISEGLTAWSLSAPLSNTAHDGDGDHPGTSGFGWSEYLDQIIDGSPVGVRE